MDVVVLLANVAVRRFAQSDQLDMEMYKAEIENHDS